MIVPFRHLGDTRSGKNICRYETKDLEYIASQTRNFDEHDHFDGFCLFQFFIIKSIRRYGEFSDEGEKMEFMAEYHIENMSDEFIAQEKKSLSLVTSIDIRNHGESLVKHIFRE